MFSTVLETVTGTLTIGDTAICTVTSLILGLVIARVYMINGTYSKNFVVSLAVMPTLIQVVIMLVNGNLGTSVAVLGTFSLIRFRSAQGTAKEITNIFLSMAIGLATGMGYVAFAIVITVVVSISMLVLYKTPFGEKPSNEKELKVTIPENLDYTGVFDDIFAAYTSKVSLVKVKTTNMGSLFELQYHIVLKDADQEKNLIDDIRCRNGNLTVMCGRVQTANNEL